MACPAPSEAEDGARHGHRWPRHPTSARRVRRHGDRHDAQPHPPWRRSRCRLHRVLGAPRGPLVAVLRSTVGWPSRPDQDREVHRVGGAESASATFPELEPRRRSLDRLAVALDRLVASSRSPSSAASIYERSRRCAASPSAAGWPRAGYAFLVNKYYLDDLYENVIVAGIAARSPGRRTGSTRTSSTRIVNGAGIGARAGRALGLPALDQRRGRRRRQRRRRGRRGERQALRPVQSGKVNQYGALLFGAAAIGALDPRHHRLGA